MVCAAQPSGRKLSLTLAVWESIGIVGASQKGCQTGISPRACPRVTPDTDPLPVTMNCLYPFLMFDGLVLPQQRIATPSLPPEAHSIAPSAMCPLVPPACVQTSSVAIFPPGLLLKKIFRVVAEMCRVSYNASAVVLGFIHPRLHETAPSRSALTTPVAAAPKVRRMLPPKNLFNGLVAEMRHIPFKTKQEQTPLPYLPPPGRIPFQCPNLDSPPERVHLRPPRRAGTVPGARQGGEQCHRRR